MKVFQHLPSALFAILAMFEFNVPSVGHRLVLMEIGDTSGKKSGQMLNRIGN